MDLGLHKQISTAQKIQHKLLFTNITQEQGDKLYEQNQIDWIGEFTLVSTEQVNNSTFYLQYGNAEMFDAQGMTYSGNIPVSANEIMLQKSFLKELGYGTELGQTISILLQMVKRLVLFYRALLRRNGRHRQLYGYGVERIRPINKAVEPPH